MNSVWFAWDTIVFIGFICVTSVVPLWHRRKDAAAGGNAKKAYIFASDGVSILSMVMSVSRGTLGVRSFLGFPSELVYFGSAMWETLYGTVLAFPLVCWIFVPVYFRLSTNSVYEYLQMRFRSVGVRRLAAATFLIRQVLHLAVTVYTPAVALYAVIGLPHWATAAALCGVSIIFNLLGGLSAAIRADVIQMGTMILISGAFIVQATIRAGGPQNVLTENIDGGRLTFFRFTWDFTERVDTLSAIIGQVFISVSTYGCQQTFVQRYCSMPSEKSVRKTLLINVPVVFILFSLSWIVGMAIYAVYRSCDPLATGMISAPDEILGYYVQDQFWFLPGMLGLFLASLFNGALSFVVSNLNSLATVTWEDFVSVLPIFKGTTDKQQVYVIKTISMIYALIVMGLSLCVGAVGGVIEGSLLVTSATSGALLGVFLLAVLCPHANSTGAIWGMVASHILTTWMAIGRILYVDKTIAMLPTSTEGCSNSTKTVLSQKMNHTLSSIASMLNPNTVQDTLPNNHNMPSGLYNMYSVSYMWYAVIGSLLCVILGSIVSVATKKESDAYDECLLHPAVVKITRKLKGVKRIFTTQDQVGDKIEISDKITENDISIIITTKSNNKSLNT